MSSAFRWPETILWWQSVVLFFEEAGSETNFVSHGLRFNYYENKTWADGLEILYFICFELKNIIQTKVRNNNSQAFRSNQVSIVIRFSFLWFRTFLFGTMMCLELLSTVGLVSFTSSLGFFFALKKEVEKLLNLLYIFQLHLTIP